MLIARDHGKIFATTFSPADAGEITIGRSQGQRMDDRAGLLLVWIDHHGGRHDHAMACAIGASDAWSCSTPIPLEDAGLRSDLIFSLGAPHGNLEIPATAHTPQRHYQITFP